MGEARELFERMLEGVEAATATAVIHDGPDAKVWNGLLAILQEALATQPDAVPELPPYLKHCEGGWHRIEFANGDSDLMDSSRDLDDLDRIAEAARILAARERARRAGR